MLHAILVGINTYKNAAIPQLSACINDTIQMQTLLAGYKTLNPTFYIYKNEAATRAALIDILQKIAKSIKPDDQFLFYFSGHGAEEYTDIIEFGKIIQGFVCYDSLSANDIPILANKEFRYLLQPIADTAAHTLVITDACHSGESTRYETPRRLDKIQAKRDWQNFVFGALLTPKKAIEMPIGKHIHISACEKDKLAYEINGAGVLTDNLIKNVQAAKGKISYELLKQRLLISIGTGKQRPDIQALNQADIFANFLTNQALQTENQTSLKYDTTRKIWFLTTGLKQTLLNPKQLNTTTFLLVNDTTILPIVLKIKSLENEIAPIANDLNLDKNKVFDIIIKGGYNALNVTISGGDASAVKKVNDSFAASDKKLAYNLNLTPTDAAHYNIIVNGKSYSPLAQIFDKKTPNLALNQAVFEPNKLWDYLTNIQKWQRIHDFQNEATNWRYPNLPIKIEVLTQNKPIVPNEKGIFVIKNNTPIEIILTNTDGRKLYVGAAQLSAQFGIKNLLLSTTTLDKKGDFVSFFGASPAFLSVAKHRLAANEPTETHIYKLLYSTDPIDMTAWQQPDIPAPETKTVALRDYEARNDFDLSIFDAPPTPDWATLNLAFLVYLHKP